MRTRLQDDQGLAPDFSSVAAELGPVTGADTSARVQWPGRAIPEKSPLELGLAAAVLLGSFAYLCLFRRYSAMEPDEGIILQGAERILHGQVLYRDFFSFYTPGSYYLLAGLFRLFGDSFLVARTALAAGGSMVSMLTYLLARRGCTRSISLFTAALVTLTCLPYRFLVLHNWDSTLWACLAVYSAVRWLEAEFVNSSDGQDGHATWHGLPARASAVTDRRLAFVHSPHGQHGHATAVPYRAGSDRRYRAWPWALAVGSFSSLTAVFEQSKGAGLVLGLAAGFLVIAASSRLSAASGPERAGGQFRRHNWIALGAGLAWPFLLTTIWFGSQHAFRPILADWLWPLHHYSLANRVPYGYQNWSDGTRAAIFRSGSWARSVVAALVVTPGFLIPVLPLVAAALFAYLSIRARRAGRLPLRTGYYVLVCGAISGLLLSVLATRSDILHFVYVAPLLYLLLAWALDGRDLPSDFFRALRSGLWILAIGTFGLLAVALLVRGFSAHQRIETPRGLVRAPEPDTVLTYLNQHVPAGTRILVYPYLPLYYYLSGTFSPTPYEYIQPGMHTAEESSEVISRLESDRTAVVLLEIDFDEKIPTSWPDTPVEFIARDAIVDFIQARYRPCQLLQSAGGWNFEFMTRKDLACPAK